MTRRHLRKNAHREKRWMMKVVARDQIWIVACSTIEHRATRKSMVSCTRTSSFICQYFYLSTCLFCDHCLWVDIFLIIISYKHWGLVQHTIISFSFFSISFHFPSSIIKQRRQFCSMHARVQSARSLFFPFVTRTGTPTRFHSSLSLSQCFPPLYCRSRAHFLLRD